MATVTPPPLPEAASQHAAGPGQPEQVVAYGQFVEQQVRRTRGQVKWVELSTGIVTLVIGVLLYLMAVVLLDRLMPLGLLGRWLALGGLLGGAGLYCIFGLLPPLLRSVNPIYAAQTLEQSTPALKNSLVNLLFLRGSRQGVSKSVLKAVEQQAATGLAHVPSDGAVDRTKLIRLGYVLLGVAALCAIYKFTSDKDPLRSIGRVVAPWSDLQAPTRTNIEDVTPGDTSVFTDQFVTVQAWVDGADDEPVTLVYSTLDGRVVNETITMQMRSEGRSYQCELPSGSQGLQQDVEYYIVAGDARSRTYKVSVLIPPAIEKISVDYRYPDYTRIPPRQSEGQGDITALEGTLVTVHVEANQEISSASVDFHCDGVPDRPMQVTGKQAQATFPLQLQDTAGHPLERYQIRFTNRDRHENPQPVRYKIDVIADLPPEIRIESPQQTELQLPLNAALPVEIWAKDRDFALSRVSILAEKETRAGDLILNQDLLAQQTAEEGMQEFTTTMRFSPAKLKLQVGDVVRLWGAARDNKHTATGPLPNVSQTDKLRIEIVESRKQEPQPSEAESKPDSSQQPEQGDERGEDPQPGENGEPMGENAAEGKQGDQGDPNSSGEQSEQRTDPENAGEAFEKIKEHLDNQQQEDSQGSGQGEQSQNQENQSGEGKQPKPGESGEKPAEHQPEGGQGEQGDQPSEQQPMPSENGGGEPKPGENTRGKGATKGGGSEDGGQNGNDPQNSSAPPSGQEKPGQKPKDGAANNQASNSQGGADKPDAANQERGGPKQGKGAGSKGAGDEESKSPPRGGDDPEQKGGDPDTERGSGGGAGERSKDNKGSPAPHEKNQEKRGKPEGNPSGEKPEDPNNAQSPSTSPKQSRSESDSEGDRSGGGGQGGGQSSNNSGTGSGGSNTAADEGSKRAPGAGQGEDSDMAGNKSRAPNKTGQSGTDPGDGSAQRTGEGNNPSGGRPEGAPPAGAKSQPQKAPQGTDPNQGQPDKSSGGPTPGSGQASAEDPTGQGSTKTGGKPGEPRRGQDSQQQETGTDPNLEYTKKATDLVLDQLKNQMDEEQVDPELLKELGWTKDELAEFVRRWEKVRNQADNQGVAGEVARNQLRNLGLRPRGTASTGGFQDDQQRGLTESFRSAPPREYEELFKAFSRGRAKGRPSRK